MCEHNKNNEAYCAYCHVAQLKSELAEFQTKEQLQSRHEMGTIITSQLNKINSLEEAIERVRELHKRITGPADDFTCQACAVDADWYPEYPCPTIKALDGEK